MEIRHSRKIGETRDNEGGERTAHTNIQVHKNSPFPMRCSCFLVTFSPSNPSKLPFCIWRCMCACVCLSVFAYACVCVCVCVCVVYVCV